MPFCLLSALASAFGWRFCRAPSSLPRNCVTEGGKAAMVGRRNDCKAETNVPFLPAGTADLSTQALSSGADGAGQEEGLLASETLAFESPLEANAREEEELAEPPFLVWDNGEADGADLEADTSM